MGLDLNTLVNKIKAEETHYFESKTKTGWLPFAQSDAFLSIFFTTFIVFASLVIPGVAYAIWKIKKIMFTLAVLNTALNTHALVTKPPTTTPSPTISADAAMAISMKEVTVMIGAIGLFFTIVKCFYFLAEMGCSIPRYHQFRRAVCGPAQLTHSVRLYLKIMNGTNRKILFLQDVDFEANLIRYTVAPKLTGVRRHACCCCKQWLALRWDTSRLIILVNNVEVGIPLQTRVNIPLFLSNRTRKAVENLISRPTFSVLIRSRDPRALQEIPNLFNEEQPIHHLITPPNSILTAYHTPSTTDHHNLPYLKPIQPTIKEDIEKSKSPKSLPPMHIGRPPSYAPVSPSAPPSKAASWTADQSTSTTTGFSSPPRPVRYVPPEELMLLATPTNKNK